MAEQRRAVARRRRAAAEAGRDRSGKALFRLGAAAPDSAIPCCICRRTIRSSIAFENLMEQEELTPDWLSLRHRLTFALRRLRGGSNRALRHPRGDLRPGGADRARAPRRAKLHHALPKKSFYAVHAEPKLFFEPSDFSALIADPGSSACTSRRKAAAASHRSGQSVCLGERPLRLEHDPKECEAFFRRKRSCWNKISGNYSDTGRVAPAPAARTDRGRSSTAIPTSSMKISAWRRRSSAIIGGWQTMVDLDRDANAAALQRSTSGRKSPSPENRNDRHVRRSPWHRPQARCPCCPTLRRPDESVNSLLAFVTAE